MKRVCLILILTLPAALLSATTAQGNAVNYEMVRVGDPGNAHDPESGKFGGVAYEYQIGKYEVTIGQYTDFLNAVAKSDPYGLYHPDMATNLNSAGISRRGLSGAYAYSVIENNGDSSSRPVAFASWFDAARFANWMHNGQPSGAQGNDTTETGAYTLNGATDGSAPAKNENAQFYIPTGNEWYKAAYFKGGGVSAGYWRFATQSDLAPGNTIGSNTNQANVYVGLYPSGTYATGGSLHSLSQNYLTDVGAFSGSQSAYGTFDQAGSLWEWNDLTGETGEFRGFWGGCWGDIASYGESVYRPSLLATNEGNTTGFRLAAPVPEPSTYALALAGIACGGYSLFRRRKRA